MASAKPGSSSTLVHAELVTLGVLQSSWPRPRRGRMPGRRFSVRAGIRADERSNGMAGQASEIVLRFLAAPFDITYGGTVHGGKLLEWIDKAGYALAGGGGGQLLRPPA